MNLYQKKQRILELESYIRENESDFDCSTNEIEQKGLINQNVRLTNEIERLKNE